MKTTHFDGFKWPPAPSHGPLRVRNQYFHDVMVDWDALRNVATALRAIDCRLDERVGYGHSHMIRKVVFTDDICWIVRLPMPEMNFKGDFIPCRQYWTEDKAREMQSEIDTMSFVLTTSTVPVPRIFASNTRPENPVGVPYMLMECVFGNSVRHMGGIAKPYDDAFLRSLARIHVPSISKIAAYT